MFLLWRGRSDWLGLLTGTLSCIAVATILMLVFHNSSFKGYLPFLFIAVIALVASRFGTWSGVLGTIAATAIFAAFLFEPVYSVRVTSDVQRSNLIWMVIVGFTASELLGVQPPREGNKRT